MKRIKKTIVCLVVILGICGQIMAEPASKAKALMADANVEYIPLRRAPYLGIFTHLEPAFNFDDKMESLVEVIESNPYISGITLKIQWQHFHPEEGTIDFEGLERLIETASEAGKLLTLGLIPGGASPDWIYDHGVAKLESVRAGIRTITAPVPWDEKYIELYKNDVRRLAERYADDPRVWAVKVLGHNYNAWGEEMHAAHVDDVLPHGWSERVFLENWKLWVDFHQKVYPDKKLMLVVSQNYRGANSENLSRIVADYFVRETQGRGILMSHQLHGRADGLAFGPTIARDYAGLAPNAHELVMSLKETPERQGTPEMTVFNFAQMGNPLFIQLWRRDSTDPQYARAVQRAWEKYAWLPMEEMKKQMKEDGVYIEDAPPPPPSEEAHQPRLSR